jgi:mevalonate kinase
LTFSRDWGLGSSSTLINNIASWAKVDAYQLLWNAFSGSGYDIACAQNDTPIFYQLENKKPIVEQVVFDPSFKEELFFVHLNKKQNSREGIQRYKEYKLNRSFDSVQDDIKEISMLSDEFVKASSSKDLEKLMNEHEAIVSLIIGLNPIKKELFPDYFGAVKSLGAWGGDFVLVTGNEETPNYFKQKGFETVLSYKEMIL